MGFKLNNITNVVSNKIDSKVKGLIGAKNLAIVDKATNALGALGIFNKSNTRENIKTEYATDADKKYSQEDFIFFRELGLHHSNHYTIEIIPPMTNVGIVGEEEDKPFLSWTNFEKYFNCFCYNVDISSPIIETTEIRTYGEPFQVPVNVTYSPFTMMFYCDREARLYHAFEAWHRSIYDRQNRTLAYIKDFAIPEFYISLIQPYVVREKGSNSIKVNNQFDVIRFSFEDLWPKNITALNLDGSQGQKVSMFNVEFNYRRMWASDYKGIRQCTAGDISSLSNSISANAGIKEKLLGALKNKGMGALKQVLPFDTDSVSGIGNSIKSLF